MAVGGIHYMDAVTESGSRESVSKNQIQPERGE